MFRRHEDRNESDVGMSDLPVTRLDSRGIVPPLKSIHMKKNMGNLDRIIRTLLALVAIYLYVAGIVSGTVGVVLIVLAGVFLFTSIVSFCPLYTLVGLSTCPTKKASN